MNNWVKKQASDVKPGQLIAECDATIRRVGMVKLRADGFVVVEKISFSMETEDYTGRSMFRTYSATDIVDVA